MKVLRCTILLLTAGIALAQPLERGTVPNDKYTAAPAPPPLGSEGWLTGRSTFFDGSDSFKNAYLARCANIAPAAVSIDAAKLEACFCYLHAECHASWEFAAKFTD